MMKMNIQTINNDKSDSNANKIIKDFSKKNIVHTN